MKTRIGAVAALLLTFGVVVGLHAVPPQPLRLLVPAPSLLAGIESTTANGSTVGGGGGGGGITSGTTPITGGATTQVCFNDGGTLACGDAGITYNKTTDILTVAEDVKAEVLGLEDSDASHYLRILVSNNLSADRIFTIILPGDAAQSLVGAYVGGNTDSTVAGDGAAAAGLRGTALGDAASAPGTDGTAVGQGALCGSGANCTIIGRASSVSSSGDNNTVVGRLANIGATAAGSILLGSSGSLTQSNTFQAGGSVVPINSVFFGVGVSDSTASASGAVVINGSGGNGSNNAGANLTVAAGKSTGTALGGSLILQTAPSGASGSSLNALANRDYFYPGVKTLTAGAATAVVRIALAQRGFAGGFFHYCVRASDATDDLMRCGDAEFAAVNKSGTETCTISVLGTDVCADTVTPGTCAVSTLTATLGCASNAADTVDITINAAAAITETTLDAGWRLQMNYGSGAVTPQ